MSESEFKKIVAAHKDPVFRFAFYFLRSRDDAEDVTQEAFVRLWKNTPRLYTSSPRAWLLRVAHNLCIDFARRRAFERAKFTAIGDSSSVAYQRVDAELDPVGELDRSELREKVLTAMDQLSESLRGAIILREIEGLSYREVSDILSVPLNTVKVNIHRARHLLRKHLAPYFSVSTGAQHDV